MYDFYYFIVSKFAVWCYNDECKLILKSLTKWIYKEINQFLKCIHLAGPFLMRNAILINETLVLIYQCHMSLKGRINSTGLNKAVQGHEHYKIVVQLDNLCFQIIWNKRLIIQPY